MLSDEIEKRKRAIKIADAINSINGVSVSKFAKELSDKWLQGNITDLEMKEMLISVHKNSNK